MNKFNIACYLCGNEAEAETIDGRNMINCSFCGCKDVLINNKKLWKQLHKNNLKKI